jgi:cytochrome oxidase Cu insertion factor (SCO1/SenC/PrrC family)
VIKDYATNPDVDPAFIIKSLTDDQLKRYKINYKVYKDKLKEWNKKQATINNINDYIMRITGIY